MYPYAFSLQICYELKDRELHISYTLKNRSGETMGGIAASIILIVSAVALLTAGIQLDAVKNQTQILFEQRVSQFEQEEKNRK